MRPIKPIWICLGDLGYSTMGLDTKTLIGSTNSLEEPGKSFTIFHWSCWSGERTSFKVITSMHDEEPYHQRQMEPAPISDSEQEGRTVTESISARLLLEQKRDATMPWRQDSTPGAAPAYAAAAPAALPGRVHLDVKPIADEELQSVRFHPDDEKYYPDQFRRWRFRFGSGSAAATSMSLSPHDDDVGWTPFYRLRGRQRLIIEMKLAPRICGIVRSRWPLATVRDFAPAGKFPLV